VLGTAAETAGELEPGQAVLIEGKVSRAKRAKKGAADEWYMTIAAYRIHKLDEAGAVRRTAPSSVTDRREYRAETSAPRQDSRAEME